MHDTARAADATTTPDPQVHIHRKTFLRIEGLRTRVSETKITLDRAALEHKEAKSAHDAAQSNLSVAVSDMLDEVNGVSKFPLFENQHDAIAQAEADPVAQKLLSRMQDHGITGLNVLIVAGYDEAQRHELADYLDALDARKQAEAEGQPLLTEAPGMPAFLAEAPAPVRTMDDIENLRADLEDHSLLLSAQVVGLLNAEQWQETEAYIAAVSKVKDEKGEALTFDDLPTAPSYLLNPAELQPKAEEAPAELTTELDEPVKKERAPRRTSKTFVNKPRIVKGKKGKK